MDASRTLASPAQTRLLSTVTPEGLLFHFPRDLGTPELLNLALNCAASQQPIAIAHASPSAAHIASTLAQAGSFEQLGLTTLPNALRIVHGEASLAYISCPLADPNFFHISFLDVQGVAFSEAELQKVIRASRFRQTRKSPRGKIRFTPSTSRRSNLLIESPSHAVRRELLHGLAGQIELATPDCSLTSDPVRAMHQSTAEWGAWIDAEGSSLQLFDRAGARVKIECVLDALATFAKYDPAQILIHPAATRRAMALEMRRSNALLGSDAHGRIWFGGEFPIADALQAVNLWARGASNCLRSSHAALPALSRLAA